MTEAAAVSIEDVRSLVAERQRYDDWLSSLEARRADTPARVFERVHADYVSRRDGVADKLRQHIGALDTLGHELDERLARLEEQLATREDERAEAMLRTAVGEFDSERWESVRQNVEASIVELGQEREGLLAEVDDVRTLLSSARSEPPAPPAPPEPEQPAEPVPVAATLPQALPGVVVPDTALPQVPLPDDLGRVAFSTDARGVAAIAPGTTNGAAEPAVGASFSADMLSTEVVAANATARRRRDADDADAAVEALDNVDVFGTPQAAPGRSPGLGASGGGDRHSTRPADASSTGTATRDAFDDLAFLRSVTDSTAGGSTTRTGTSSTEQSKTLRCTECGTMNFPTEWYCERCGGELAAF